MGKACLSDLYEANKLVQHVPTEIASQASAPAGAPQPADESAGEAASAGADWESAAKRRGRPPKAAVMPHGALDKYVVTPTA
eukprot:3902228-Amphidinium_carterae.1